MRCPRYFLKYGVFAGLLFVVSGWADVQHEETISTQSVRDTLAQIKELQLQGDEKSVVHHEPVGGENAVVHDKHEPEKNSEKKTGSMEYQMLDFEVLEASVQKIEQHMHDLEQEVLVLKKRISWLKDVAGLLQTRQNSVSEKKEDPTVDVDKKQEPQVRVESLSQTQTSTNGGDNSVLKP